MADEIRDYDFAVAPVGDDYRRVIKLATDLSASVGLMFESDRRTNIRRDSVTKRLHPYLVVDEMVLEVPGSTHFEPRRRRRYRACDEVAQILGTASRDLFGWAYPALPIAPHFLRDDGSAILTTIEGEDYAFVSLSDDELDRWNTAGAPALRPCQFEQWSASEWVTWILPELEVASYVTRDLPWYLSEGTYAVKPVINEYLRIAERFESDDSPLGLLLEIEAVDLDEIDGAEFTAGGGPVDLTVLRSDEPRYELGDGAQVVQIASNYNDVSGVDVYLHSERSELTLWFVRPPRELMLEDPIASWWTV